MLTIGHCCSLQPSLHTTRDSLTYKQIVISNNLKLFIYCEGGGNCLHLLEMNKEIKKKYIKGCMNKL